MKNNLIKMFAVLSAIFCVCGTVNAEQTIPAKIDATKLTTNAVHVAIQTCGLKLVREVLRFPICEKYDHGCEGYFWDENQVSTKEISPDTIQADLSYGMKSRYRDRHPYDGKSYGIDLLASKDLESNALKFTIIQDSRDEGAGKSSHVDIRLITEGEMPLLRYNKKEIKHCSYDQWGNKNCGPNTYEYSDPQWVLSDKFAPRVNWKNINTNIVIDKTADFAKYMACVEKIF